MSTPSTLDTPRPVAMMRDQLFEFIVERTDLAASYARSASEAAWRGDQLTVGVHLKQLRLATIAALQTFRELGPEADA
jgi:hypothetical protein